MSVILKSNGEPREFHFTQQDFERVKKLIYAHAGISLSSGKIDMVYSRLARRLRAHKLASFSDYLALLEDDASPEWEAFTNALTTNLTSFFREQHHFPILAAHLKKQKGRHPLRIWCVAASTGEEPYSIAMTAAEVCGLYNPQVSILASDLDTQVLATAERGVYPLERVEKLPADKLSRYFLKGTGSNAGQVKVRKELCDRVQFLRINLLDERWPIKGAFDVIFCRNVMIYFDKRTQYEILRKFVPYLHPDGLLFAGHSESFHHASDLFTPCGKTVYRLTHGASR
jgi:chemotaxis protein methyltransferase CheR